MAQSQHPRRNPDAKAAGKSLAVALGSAALLAVAARKAEGMKKANQSAAYTPKQIYSGVAVVGGIAGLALASSKNPLMQIAGTAVLGATAALAGPPLYTLLTTPVPANAPAAGSAETDTPPAGQRKVAVGQPRLMLDGSPVPPVNGQPVVRSEGLFGITAADLREQQSARQLAGRNSF